MKRLTTLEALAFAAPVLSMIAIVLLMAFGSSFTGSGQAEQSDLEPHIRTAISAF